MERACQHLPYEVASPWFQGTSHVRTFALDELIATKLRALYQRRKGRDLFDIWHVLVARNTDDARIVAGLEHYMGDQVFTYPQLAQNLKAKLDDPDFSGDLFRGPADARHQDPRRLHPNSCRRPRH